MSQSPDQAICPVLLNGTPADLPAGLSVAAALTQAGQPGFSRDKDGTPRGLFCGMGACHDCLVTINGRTGQRACMARIAPGMRIDTVAARPDIRDPALTDLAPLPEHLPLQKTEVAIVGGGPAGLAAARNAARLGLQVVLLDERQLPGGQFFKQPATAGAQTDSQSKRGAALIEDVRASGAEIRPETTVWGASRDEGGAIVLSCLGTQGAYYLRCRQLVVATGAYERPAAIPGWTAPGCMTTGAAQTLLRAYGTLPGKRVLITGNGPLNIQVAHEIRAHGGQVAGIVEVSAEPWSKPGMALRLFRTHPGLARQGMARLTGLIRTGVPLYWQSRLTEVRQEAGGLRAHILTPKGPQEIAADCVLMGGSFASDNNLSRLLGCAHDMIGGQMVIRRGPRGETSCDDVHVVGEAGQFGGAEVALTEGMLAADAIHATLRGHRSDTGPLRKRRARALAFQSALWSLFAPDAPVAPGPAQDRILCRCERVTAMQLARAGKGAAPDMATLKRLTRAGMGRCQGRYCSAALDAATANPQPATEMNRGFAPQIPIRPVPLAALALEKGEWGGHKRALLPNRTPHPAEPFTPQKTDVAVIGAGVVGVSTALFLARQGVDVTLLEHGRVNSVASGGNAGSLHAQLLSFDHGARAEGDGGPAARTLPLQRDSIALWGELETELGQNFERKITGGLMVAETPDQMDFLRDKTAVERAMGIDAQVIGQQELASMEPALNSGFIGAAWCPLEGKINPLVATQHLLNEARRLGVRLWDTCTVTGMERHTTGFAIATSRGEVRAGRVVNAAGAFAGPLGKLLGCEVPVFGAPLQMVVTEAAAPAISTLVAHADRHLTLKQAANGNFIIGGGWTAGLDPVHQHPRPLTASLEGNLWVAQHVLPGLRKLHVLRSWAAMNINIDGAPILGEDPRCAGLFHAVTSNGYTLGPLMGQLTAALITKQDPGRNLAAFSLARFS